MKVHYFASELEKATDYIFVNNSYLNKSYEDLRRWILGMALDHADTNDTYVSCGGVLVIYEEIEGGDAVIMQFYVDPSVTSHDMEEDFTTRILGED